MGCSNAHPHGQIWATSSLPSQVAVKDRTQSAYMTKYGRPMLMDYAKKEMKKPLERVVCDNADWMVVVPYWATWPYETMILPKRRHVLRLSDLTAEERMSLAEIMKEITTRYDNMFQTSFPYSFGWFQAPYAVGSGSDKKTANDWWQLHAVYMPPLLRSASVKKHMVGYELCAESQRDLTAEQAAAKLRALSPVHYTEEMWKEK